MVNQYVGRVGALAVALGVGGMIAGMPVAAAENGNGPDSDAGSTQVTRNSPEPSPRAPRTPRSDASDRDGRAGSGTAGERRARGVTRPGADAPEADGPRTGRDRVTVPDLSETPADLPVPTPVAATPIEGSPIGDSPVPVAPAAADLPAAFVPQISPVLVPAPPAQLPVMTSSAPTGVLMDSGSRVLHWLGGRNGGGIPGAAPLVWAAAAASRRELSVIPPLTAPVVLVTTSKPAAPDALSALSDRIAGLEILAGIPGSFRTGIATAAATWINRTFGSSAVPAVTALVAVIDSGRSLSEVTGQVSDALAGWWANPAVGARIGALADSLVADFLTAPGVTEALYGAVGRIAGAQDAAAELPAAVRALLNDDVIRDAVDAAIAGALDSLPTDLAPAVSALGTTVSGLVSDLTGDPALGATIADQVVQLANSALQDIPPVGSVSDAVAAWFGTATGRQVSAVIDSVAADLLGAPGVAEALAGAADRIVNAADPDAELSGAVRELLGSDAVRAAVEATVSGALNSVLDDIAPTVSGWVAGLMGDSTAGALVGSALSGFLGHPGVSSALTGIAGEAASSLLAGVDPAEVLARAWTSLQGDPAILAAVGVVMSGAVGDLLNDTEVLVYVRSAVSTVMTDLVGDAELGAQAAEQLVPLMVSVLVDGPVAVEDFEGPITDLLTGLIAAADPGLAELAPRLAAAGFAILKAGLLDDFSAVPALISGLATDPAVLAILGERIGGIDPLAGLPAGIRDAVGEAAAYWFSQALGSSAVTEALTSVLQAVSFPSGSDAVAEFLSGLVESGFDLEATLTGLVGPDVAAALRALLGDADVQQALGTATTDTIAMLADSVLGQIDPALAGALGALAGPLSEVAGAVLTSFLNQPGIDQALATEAFNAILAALGGQPLPGGGSIVAAAGQTVTDVLTALLSDPDFVDTLSTAVTDAVTGLTADPGVRAWLTDQLVTALGEAPGVAGLAEVVAAAVSGLLSDVAIQNGLGAVAASVVSGFLGQTDAVAALAGLAGEITAAVLGGTDPAAALQSALQALQSDPDIRAALIATIGVVLGTVQSALLDDVAVQQTLGTTVAALITGLAEDPAVRAAIETQLGATLGPIIVGMLDGGTADVLGLLITDLLGQPGFSGALTGAADRVAAAVLGGADVQAAVQAALIALQSDPAFQAALDVVLPAYLGSIVQSDVIRDGLGEAARGIVTDLLRDNGLDIPIVTPLVGQLVEAATVSLLGNPAFGDLLGTLAAAVLDGTPTADLTGIVVSAILTDGSLQAALGTAVGQAIGSLLGDNIFGAVVGQVTGFGATLVIGLAAGIAVLFNPGLVRPAAAVADPGGRGYWELVVV